MHHPSDNSRPAGLMACTKTSSVIAMEVFVEQDVVAPVRIFLELPRSSIDGPPAIFVPQKDTGQAACDLLGHLIESHALSRARRTFHGKSVPVVHVILHQGADDQTINRHPDRAPPVG